jgi:hypothetical protein
VFAEGQRDIAENVREAGSGGKCLRRPARKQRSMEHLLDGFAGIFDR